MEPLLADKQETRYGGFWIRFAAAFIDSIILGIPGFIISVIIFIFIFNTTGLLDAAINDPNFIEHEMTDADAFALLGGYAVMIIANIIMTVLYFAGFHASKWQGTVGKKLLGLKVTDLHGDRISFLRGVGRYLAMAFLSSIFMIGYIIAAFTEKKQSLHDLIASTVVIRNE